MDLMDWNQERRRFPAAERHTYLYSAAAGPLSRESHEALSVFQDRMMNDGDFCWEEGIDCQEDCRHRVAALLGVADQDIAFTGSSALGMNFLAMMNPRGRVLMPEEEFPSSIYPWEHHGHSVRKVPVRTLLETVQGLRPQEVEAVVCSSVQYATGYRADLLRMGEILHQKAIPFFVNATQGFGAFPLNLKQIHAAGMVASCHKWLCAGYGTSVLVLSPTYRASKPWPVAGWLSVDDPMQLLPEMPELKQATSALELGCPPMANFYSLRESLKAVERIGVENIGGRIVELSRAACQRLQKEVPGIQILSERDGKPWERSIDSGIFLVASSDPEKEVAALAEKNVWVSSRGNGIRVAFHYFNSTADIDCLVAAYRDFS